MYIFFVIFTVRDAFSEVMCTYAVILVACNGMML